jgi:hypothetical protein
MSEQRYVPIPDPLGIVESAFRKLFPNAPVVPHDPLASKSTVEKLAADGDIGEIPDRPVLHSVPYAFGSPGIVVDEAKARATPCKYVEYAPGKRLSWSPGIVGALSDEQERQYCSEWIEVKRPAVVARMRGWQDAVNVCKAEIANVVGGHERVEAWLNCMSRELKRRGIEV